MQSFDASPITQRHARSERCAARHTPRAPRRSNDEGCQAQHAPPFRYSCSSYSAVRRKSMRPWFPRAVARYGEGTRLLIREPMGPTAGCHGSREAQRGADVAKPDNLRWSLYGDQRSQSRATGGKRISGETGSKRAATSPPGRSRSSSPRNYAPRSRRFAECPSPPTHGGPHDHGHQHAPSRV
jgi:hypothetical protein